MVLSVNQKTGALRQPENQCSPSSRQPVLPVIKLSSVGGDTCSWLKQPSNPARTGWWRHPLIIYNIIPE
jgi:hypothetical protein